jgi:hypothetical protein
LQGHKNINLFIFNVRAYKYKDLEDYIDNHSSPQI